MDFISGYGRASPGFGSDSPTGSGQERGRHTLVVSDHSKSGSGSPIGLDRKGVLQYPQFYVIFVTNLHNKVCIIYESDDGFFFFLNQVIQPI